MFRKVIVTGLIVSALASGAAQAADGRNGALLGGLAIGAVGGAVLGSALAQQRPVYVAPPPPVYVAAPRPVYVQPAAVDPYDDQMFRLHAACDTGNRGACIRFGVLIGQHQEKMAEWRRSHPDFFNY